MAPSRRNPCSCATRPRPAPIARPAPRPSRSCAIAPNGRSDKLPNRTSRPTPRSSRHHCKPSGLRCTAASRERSPLRVVAKRNHSPSSPTIRRRARASRKTSRSSPSNASPPESHRRLLRSLPLRSILRLESDWRFRDWPTLFHAPRFPPAVGQGVVSPLPIFPRQGGPAPGVRPRLFVPPRFAVSGRKRKRPGQRSTGKQKTSSWCG